MLFTGKIFTFILFLVLCLNTPISGDSQTATNQIESASFLLDNVSQPRSLKIIGYQGDISNLRGVKISLVIYLEGRSGAENLSPISGQVILVTSIAHNLSNSLFSKSIGTHLISSRQVSAFDGITDLGGTSGFIDNIPTFILIREYTVPPLREWGRTSKWTYSPVESTDTSNSSSLSLISRSDTLSGVDITVEYLE